MTSGPRRCWTLLSEPLLAGALLVLFQSPLSGCGPVAPEAAESAAASQQSPESPSPAPVDLAPVDLAPRPGDLLILDGDAGELLLDGERLGVIFLARSQGDGSFAEPVLLASDPRWREPTDMVLLGDGTILVMESQWSPEPRPSRGSLFVVRPPVSVAGNHSLADVSLWWSDKRLRRPVSVARNSETATVYVSDRDANPLGLNQATGCVIAVPRLPESAEPHQRLGEPGVATLAGAGPELVTPGPIVVMDDGTLLLMDADANPNEVLFEDGRRGTPGVLFAVLPEGLKVELEPRDTVSPIGFLLGEAGELYVIDANKGQRRGVMGDGAVFRRKATGLELVVDSVQQQRPRAMVDPAGGDTLADGRLVIADANIDPLALGEDGTGKGVYGTGPGAVLVVDVALATVETLIADERFVMPLTVKRVRP